MSYILKDIADYIEANTDFTDVFVDTYAGDEGDNTAISDKIYLHSDSSPSQPIQGPWRELDFSVYVRRTTNQQAITDSLELSKLLRSNISLLPESTNQIIFIQVISHPFRWSNQNAIPEMAFRCKVRYSDIDLTS